MQAMWWSQFSGQFGGVSLVESVGADRSFMEAVLFVRHVKLLKNAIAIFSSEMSEDVSKSTSHPRTMMCAHSARTRWRVFVCRGHTFQFDFIIN